MQPAPDLYLLFKSKPSLGHKLKIFAKTRGVELTIALVGIFIGFATVLVSYKVGIHQEILQASRMTDSYFNGIVDLYAKSMDENQRINLLMIARTDAIIEDLNRLHKPEKIASVIGFVSNLKPNLFYKEQDGDVLREKYIYLGHLDLSGTTLRNINLEKARLSSSNLKDSDLTHANLQYAVLKRVQFENAILNNANLNYTDLRNANLKNALISHATFENANLEGAIWVNGIRCKQGSIGHCLYR